MSGMTGWEATAYELEVATRRLQGLLDEREAEVRRLRERVDQLSSLLAAESARVAERDAIIARVGALKVVSAWDGIVAGDWIDADDVQAILRGSA